MQKFHISILTRKEKEWMDDWITRDWLDLYLQNTVSLTSSFILNITPFLWLYTWGCFIVMQESCGIDEQVQMIHSCFHLIDCFLQISDSISHMECYNELKILKMFPTWQVYTEQHACHDFILLEQKNWAKIPESGLTLSCACIQNPWYGRKSI